MADENNGTNNDPNAPGSRRFGLPTIVKRIAKNAVEGVVQADKSQVHSGDAFLEALLAATRRRKTRRNTSSQSSQRQSTSSQPQGKGPEGVGANITLKYRKVAAPHINTGDERIDYEVTRVLAQAAGAINDFELNTARAFRAVGKRLIALETGSPALVKRIDLVQGNQKTLADQIGYILKSLDEQGKAVKRAQPSNLDKQLKSLRERAAKMERDERGRFVRKKPDDDSLVDDAIKIGEGYAGAKTLKGVRTAVGKIGKVASKAAPRAAAAAETGAADVAAPLLEGAAGVALRGVGRLAGPIGALLADTTPTAAAENDEPMSTEYQRKHGQASLLVQTPEETARVEEALKKEKEAKNKQSPSFWSRLFGPNQAQAAEAPQSNKPEDAKEYKLSPYNMTFDVGNDIEMKAFKDFHIKGQRVIIEADELKFDVNRVIGVSGMAPYSNPENEKHPGTRVFRPGVPMTHQDEQGGNTSLGTPPPGQGGPQLKSQPNAMGGTRAFMPKLSPEAQATAQKVIKEAVEGKRSLTDSAVDKAMSMLGAEEHKDRQNLIKYLKTGGVGLDPATTSWCAAFLNSTLAQSGIKGTGSNVATDFLKWGKSVDKPGDVRKGDILVQSRGHRAGETGGHVMMATGKTRMRNGVLQYEYVAGNEGNRVNRSFISSNLVQARRASDEDLPDEVVKAQKNRDAVSAGKLPEDAQKEIFKTLADQRASFMDQIKNDPKLKNTAMAMMLSEEGSDSKARKALLETVLNRSVAHGYKDLLNQGFNRQYYAPFQDGSFNRNLQKVLSDPKLRDRLQKEIDEVGRGSNYSNYATQNGSGSVGAHARETQSVGLIADNKETFSRKDREEFARLHGVKYTEDEKEWYQRTQREVKEESKLLPAPSREAADYHLLQPKPVKEKSQEELMSAYGGADMLGIGMQSYVNPDKWTTYAPESKVEVDKAFGPPPAPTSKQSETKEAQATKNYHDTRISKPRHDPEAAPPTPGSDGYGSGACDPDGGGICVV